jgi:hypothetical protein
MSEGIGMMSPMTPSEPPSASWSEVIKTTARLLTFRASETELASLGSKHLVFGLVCTWIVGIGRYWDNPRVGLLQHLGIGSVVYIFALALLLWLVAWPLKPKHWSYSNVVTFVALVSPPAALYAIPVEKFFSLDTADFINVWFLAIVALWRVVLLIYFMRVAGRLSAGSVIVASFLPLTLIVVALSSLNLEKAVFSFMGGLSEQTPNDGAFAILLLLSVFSVLMFVPLLLVYLVLIVLNRTTKQSDAKSARELG